jgi:hypothetical protein
MSHSIIERHPIIMRDPEPWEAEYYAMQEQLMQHGKVRLNASHVVSCVYLGQLID